MSKEKVLVIDTDKGSRDAIKILLELNDIEVSVCRDNAGALHKLSQESFDLVLGCADTAASDPFAVLKMVVGSQIHYRTPFVLLTDNEEEKERRTAMNMGAADYVVKPVQGKMLMQVLNAKLENKRRQTQLYNKDINDRVFTLLNRNFNQELLTPLNGIINTTSLLETIGEVEHIDGLTDVTRAMHASTFRMRRVTRNLLTYAELTSGVAPDVEGKNKPVALDALLEQIISVYDKGYAPDQSHIILNKVQVGTWTGPEEYVSVIFTELIDNAVKFSAAGCHPVADLKVVNDSFTFSVTNTPKDRINFGSADISPFKKFHHNISHNGMGLGLYMCKSICERMGYIFAMRREGDNITFSVTSGM